MGAKKAKKRREYRHRKRDRDRRNCVAKTFGCSADRVRLAPRKFSFEIACPDGDDLVAMQYITDSWDQPDPDSNLVVFRRNNWQGPRLTIPDEQARVMTFTGFVELAYTAYYLSTIKRIEE